MERSTEIKLSLLVLVSLFIHIIVLLTFVLPDYYQNFGQRNLREKILGSNKGRDLIININEDNKRIITEETLLSEKDSSAKGFITRKKGDNFLNNSLAFKFQRGSARTAQQVRRKIESARDSALRITDNTELIISMMQMEQGAIDMMGEDGSEDFTKIPDIKGTSRENAIFYSNDGRFSFNTLKFKNFKYFMSMKDKIASQWFPPILANSVIYGYNSYTGAYTPGRMRIMAIPNQEVKLYFSMNRNGDVLNVVIMESMGNVYLNKSCVDSIVNSKNFGKVPADIPGEVIYIRFIFGYYVY